MIENWKRERQIRKVLANLAKQRVVTVLPGNVPVIEKSLKRNEVTEACLATCLMRGWVEPLYEEMPVSEFDPDNWSLPQSFARTQTIYRLTEGGWAAHNRAHVWTLINVAIALLALIATLLAAS
jgi:ASC-1-like (ASCH) protein